MMNKFFNKRIRLLSLCMSIIASCGIGFSFNSPKTVLAEDEINSTQITENIAKVDGAVISGNTVDGEIGVAYQGEIPYVITGDSDLNFTFSTLTSEQKGTDFALNFTYTICAMDGTPVFDVVYKGDGEMATQVYVKYNDYTRSHTYNLNANSTPDSEGWYFYNQIPSYCQGWAAPSLFGTYGGESTDTGSLTLKFVDDVVQVWTSYYIAQDNWTSVYSLRSSTVSLQECLIAEFDGTDSGFDHTSRMEKGMTDNGWGLPKIYDQLKDGYRLKFNTTNVGSDSTNYDIGVTFNSLTASTLVGLHTVTFDPNNELDDSTVVEIKDGNVLDESQIPVPQKTGYIFAGWYCDEVKFDVSNPITGDMQLTAKWVNENLGEVYTEEAFCAGASIRLAEDGKSGIRFHVRMPYNTYLGENINTLTTGMLVIPSDKLGNTELTHTNAVTQLINGARAADETTTGRWQVVVDEDDGISYMETKVYVYNVPEDSYDRGFTFRGYIQHEGNYYYTSTSVSRSITYVAMHENHTLNTQGENGNISYSSAQLAILGQYSPTRTKISANLANVDKYYYRVGNQNEVSFEKLFETIETHTDIAPINLSIKFKTLQGNATGSYANGAFTFTNTGFLEISVLDTYSRNATVLTVEVIDAKNITSATGSTSTSIVLLNDVQIASGGYVRYSNCTVYGNGFTFSVSGGVTTYASAGNKWGIIQLSNNATLDNLVIIGDEYTTFGTYTSDSYTTAAVYSQGGTIQNCYIEGCASPVMSEGNTTIKNTTLYGGAVACLQLKGGANTLENVTTVNYNDGRSLIGLGVIVRDDAPTTTTLTLNGTLKQYNFVSNNDAPSSGTLAQIYSLIFDTAQSQYHFDVSGTDYANTGIVSMTTNFTDSNITDNTSNGYVGKSVSKTIWFTTIKGYVYTQPNTVGSVDNSYNKTTDTHIASVQGDQNFQVEG